MKEIVMPNGDRGYVLETDEEAAAAEQLSSVMPRGRIKNLSNQKILAELVRRFPVTERVVVKEPAWAGVYNIRF